MGDESETTERHNITFTPEVVGRVATGAGERLDGYDQQLATLAKELRTFVATLEVFGFPTLHLTNAERQLEKARLNLTAEKHGIQKAYDEGLAWLTIVNREQRRLK